MSEVPAAFPSGCGHASSEPKVLVTLRPHGGFF